MQQPFTCLETSIKHTAALFWWIAGTSYHCLLFVVLYFFWSTTADAQALTLEEDLRGHATAELVKLAREQGDAARGAIVFHQPHMACSRCHLLGDSAAMGLGPPLAKPVNQNKPSSEETDEYLVESVLLPSKVIKKGFESITVVTVDGKATNGLIAERTRDKIVLRDVARSGELYSIASNSIDEVVNNTSSIMPTGLVNQLTSRQQFFDLIRYLIEIRDGGITRANELQPSPTLLTYQLPAYERRLDHAGLIQSWNQESLQRGEAIYNRVCANCHGTHDKVGSLPISLRFAEGKFKNGSDPFAMYQTLTRGFGLMAPQAWMVPIQKYDVIHYIHEVYLKNRNPGQYTVITADYLSALPDGTSRGPAPSLMESWAFMDYGPHLTHTFEVPGPALNLAYKGIAIRLDPGAGGVSRGQHWSLFDTDTLRMAANWSSVSPSPSSFTDWEGIQFNGRHGVHPRIVGKVTTTNRSGPGWAQPNTGSFVDEQRILGRDGRRYGPLPRDWAKYRGMYHFGQQVVLSYSVGTTEILELPRVWIPDQPGAQARFCRTFNIGPRDRDLLLNVADVPDHFTVPDMHESESQKILEVRSAKVDQARISAGQFDGNHYWEVGNGNELDLNSKDFSIVCRFRTTEGGSLFSFSQPGEKWIPNGQSLFIRDGHLCFDIGWVGCVTSELKVNDGKWHTATFTWEKSSGLARIYVDGKFDSEGKLRAKAKLTKGVVRLGYTSSDFPKPKSSFLGEISEVRFYQTRLTEIPNQLDLPTSLASSARWIFQDGQPGSSLDLPDHPFRAILKACDSATTAGTSDFVVGISPLSTHVTWTNQSGQLRLGIPAGRESLRFTVWQNEVVDGSRMGQPHETQEIPDSTADLTQLTKGGSKKWQQTIETTAQLGPDAGPFAVDVLTPPDGNPWLAQMRFTGLDFLPDGRMAVCTWDGDVWIVEATKAAKENANSTPGTNADVVVGQKQKLLWKRIASGLFQPLGLKVVEGKICLTCRDQLVKLHDLNFDEEIDYYECLNNDHQVTEHFHEFAMGLQTDQQGNFYYAKSARHALPAVIPQHGTLLRVSSDGLKTEILANGFRAANGVCLNPDGSFFVTDQEGHWNPKNRINWVTESLNGTPKFYGNMFGYHDVTDSSDAAMVPPLCWITNAFDRSPAELLWVQSENWGKLNGALLNLSYGTGKLFLVPHEKLGGVMQGGMIELPISPLPTGVMRGRFYPGDGHLYVCGMFAWAGNAIQPGGLYRIRATGKPMCLPVGLNASKDRLTLEFTAPLDPTIANLEDAFSIRTWTLKRSQNYGSSHFGEKSLKIEKIEVSADGKHVALTLPKLAPTWCMEIKYQLKSNLGSPVHGVIHNTIHQLAD